jgi:hypothetical protein
MGTLRRIYKLTKELHKLDVISRHKDTMGFDYEAL